MARSTVLQIKNLATSETFNGYRRFPGNVDGFSKLKDLGDNLFGFLAIHRPIFLEDVFYLAFPAQSSNLGNQSPDVVGGKVIPWRHRRAGHAPRDGSEEILIAGTVVGGDESESSTGEISRLGVQKVGSLSITPS